jgi:hypothetical protein
MVLEQGIRTRRRSCDRTPLPDILRVRYSSGCKCSKGLVPACTSRKKMGQELRFNARFRTVSNAAFTSA